MTNRILKTPNWIRRTLWLIMVVSFLAMPNTSIAAKPKPQQFGLSSYLPFLLNRHCSGTLPTTIPFGVQVYGRTGSSQDHSIALQDSNSTWLRNEIRWASVEPTNRETSEYQWVQADAAVQAAVDNCMNLIVTLEGTPDWATISYERAPIKSELLHEYVEYVTAVVERYDGDGIEDAPSGAVVNYWEFYNEPDLGSTLPGHEGWGDHGGRYAEMLKAIYDPVHDANPNAKVVFGGIAYEFFTEQGGLFVREFFQNVLEAGGGEYFDIMNFHYYPFQHNRISWAQNNSSGLMEKVADIKGKLQAKGLDKPLLITEVGWHSNNNVSYPSTPEYQSRQVVQLLTQSMASGSIATIWWPLVDITSYAFDSGLTTSGSPNTIKPSYTVYQELVKRLGISEFKEVVYAASIDNDLEVYKFYIERTNQYFYVAWLNPTVPYGPDEAASFDDSVHQDLQLSGSIATVFAKDGTLLQTVTDGIDGTADNKITITVGRSPIYIEVN